ncbi:MAG: DUF2946 family protein [Methylophilaceae bacterium]
MFSCRYQLLISKIAVFLVLFASLAPSVSHAIMAQNNSGSFLQEVCTSTGEKVVVQVVTSKGKQLATVFETTQQKKSTPATIVHHLEHCPFCANPSTDAVIQAPHALIVAILAAQAQHISALSQDVLPRFSVLPPPAQAPPAR